MATTIDVDGANTYFLANGYKNNALWLGMSDDDQTGMIANATAVMTRALGRTITDEDTDSNSSYRPDYAVYEQAVYMFVNSNAMADGTLTAPKYFGDDGQGDSEERQNPDKICMEARKWMDWNAAGSLSLLRG